MDAAASASPSTRRRCHDADRTPRLPDEDRTWLAFGAQYRMSKQAAFDVGYAHLFVEGREHQPLQRRAGGRESGGVRGKNNLVGTYDGNVNILSAQFRYSF